MLRAHKYFLLSFLAVANVPAALPVNVQFERTTILGSYYFNPNSADVIGVVLIDVPFDGHKAFIGTVSGMSKSEGEKFIAETGARFPLDLAHKLIK